MTEDTVNGGATNPQSDTPVTQPRSLDVRLRFDAKAVRASLDALRAMNGADTPIGHCCSNLIEQLRNYETAEHWTQKWELRKRIDGSMAELAKLSK